MNHYAHGSDCWLMQGDNARYGNVPGNCTCALGALKRAHTALGRIHATLIPPVSESAILTARGIALKGMTDEGDR